MSSSQLSSSTHSSVSSSTTSTPRIVLSPLNPASTPPTAPAASLEELNTISLWPHHRHSTPNLVQLTDPGHQFVNVISPDGTSSSLPSSPTNAFDDGMKSTFRDLSRSIGSQMKGGELRVEDSDHSSNASWWGDSEKHVARPWHNLPKKKKTVPSEQIEALQSTRKVSDNVIPDRRVTFTYTWLLFRESHKPSHLHWELLQISPMKLFLLA